MRKDNRFTKIIDSPLLIKDPPCGITIGACTKSKHTIIVYNLFILLNTFSKSWFISLLQAHITNTASTIRFTSSSEKDIECTCTLSWLRTKPTIWHKNSSVTTLDKLLASKFYSLALTSLNNISQFFACYMKYSFLVIFSEDPVLLFWVSRRGFPISE